MRTFGIELEIVLPSAISSNQFRTAETALRNAGLIADFQTYNHITSPSWKITTDGSLGAGGCEVVSPVLQGAAGIIEARRAAEALRAAGFTVDRSCGFHVHIGASDLTAKHVKALLRRYASFEAEIDALMPPSRRGNANTFCRSVAAHASAVESRPDNEDPAMLARRLGDRYVKLNLQSLWRQGTVEFRHHSGTVEADKIESWIRFCLAFVDASKADALPAGTGFVPSADYRRQVRRNYGNIIEQVEAAGGTMTLSAPRSRTYTIAGPRGSFQVTTAQLNRLYRTDDTTLLNPVAFEMWWSAYVAPILPAIPAAGDSLWAGIPATVQAFYAARRASFARRGATP